MARRRGAAADSMASGVRLNAVDRVVSWFSPRAAYDRARFRYAESMLKRHYEGASVGRRTAGWVTPGTSANAEIMNSVWRLRARSRDLVRNNPYIASAATVVENNVVGFGIVPQAAARSKAAVARMQALWKSWGGTTACDYDGRLDFYGMQSLAMRTIFESGSVLVRRVWVSDSSLPLPMQLQVLEPDYLDTRRDGPVSGGGIIKQGIEFDAAGRRVAYWLLLSHPGDAYNLLSAQYKSVRVPADEVRHIYRIDRAGQIDGVPMTSLYLMS